MKILLGMLLGFPLGIVFVLVVAKIAEHRAFRDYWGP